MKYKIDRKLITSNKIYVVFEKYYDSGQIWYSLSTALYVHLKKHMNYKIASKLERSYK